MCATNYRVGPNAARDYAVVDVFIYRTRLVRSFISGPKRPPTKPFKTSSLRARDAAGGRLSLIRRIVDDHRTCVWSLFPGAAHLRCVDVGQPRPWNQIRRYYRRSSKEGFKERKLPEDQEPCYWTQYTRYEKTKVKVKR